MSTITAVFKKSPAENRRYTLDYTLDLASGESVSSIAVSVTQVSGPASGPLLVINNVALLPAVAGVVTGATYFASAGSDGSVYEVQFLTTTSLTEILETVVQYNVAVKL